MTNKNPFEIGVEIHRKIDESLREFGEAFITKDGEIIHPEKVKVETDENGKTIYCVGKSVDNEVFALISKKETAIADILRPRPYQEDVMRAIMDPDVAMLGWPRREPTFRHNLKRYRKD